MPLGLLDVMPPAMFEAARYRLVHGTNDLRRESEDDRARRNIHPLKQHRTRTNNRSPADAGAVENDRPHPDQAIVLNGTTVQDDAVADGHPLADHARYAWVGVD